MLILLDAVRDVPNTAGLQIPLAQDKAVVQNVDQVVVDLHHCTDQWCLEPFQHNALDEIPSLFRVNEIARVKDEMDVVREPRRKTPVRCINVVTADQRPQKASRLERVVHVRPATDWDVHRAEEPLGDVDVETWIRIVHRQTSEAGDGVLQRDGQHRGGGGLPARCAEVKQAAERQRLKQLLAHHFYYFLWGIDNAFLEEDQR